MITSRILAFEYNDNNSTEKSCSTEDGIGVLNLIKAFLTFGWWLNILTVVALTVKYYTHLQSIFDRVFPEYYFLNSGYNQRTSVV